MKYFTPSFSNMRKIGFLLVAMFAMTNVTIAQNFTKGGKIAADQTVCPGEAPDMLTNVESPSGGDTSLDPEYLWMVGSSANFPVGFTAAPGDNDGLEYTPPAVGVTSFFIRCARRAGYTEYQAESNIVTIHVANSPTAIINGAPSGVIYSGATVDLSAAYSINSTYEWYVDGYYAGSGQTFSETFYSANTYTVTLYVYNSNGCVGITSVDIEVSAPKGFNSIHPCSCDDPLNYATSATDYFLHDFILINSNAGETWTLKNNYNSPLYDATGAVLPIGTGTALTETADGVYGLDVWYKQGERYNSRFANGDGYSVYLDQSGIGCGCANPLPVSLVSFDATVVGSDVELKWATASETNNSHFELERSLDGGRFDMIAKVEGAGNSTETLSYSFMDKDAVEGINYYRLKQVDFDGTSEYFTIVTATIEDAKTTRPSLQVTPNPVIHVAKILLEGNIVEGAEYQLINLTGQIIRTVSVTSDVQEIDMNDLKAGVYFVNLLNGEERIIQKVIKQ